MNTLSSVINVALYIKVSLLYCKKIAVKKFLNPRTIQKSVESNTDSIYCIYYVNLYLNGVVG